MSTNTTSYLLVMQANGMLKHHTVDATMSKANLGKGLMTLNPVKYWPHWSAILKEKESGQKYAVDRWPFDQGENAAVVKVEDWYMRRTTRVKGTTRGGRFWAMCLSLIMGNRS